MASKVETILEEIKGLTLLEASDLVKKMEEAFGVSAAAAAPVMVAGGGGGGRGSGGREDGICRRSHRSGREQDQRD
jgi:large subunit ribosomal protein L7/L12